MNFRERLLLSKIEGTYATDSAPTGAADAMLTSDLTITPLQGETVQRNTDRPTLGGELAIHVGTHVGVEFGVEIAGAGSAGGVPAYEPLLRACGLAETNNPGISQVYDPISDGFESVTNHAHFAGQRHGMVGCRGNVRLVFDPRQLPHFMFNMIALWQGPASVADPTPDWSNFQTPLAVTNDNMPTATLHGETLTLVRAELDLGNQVKYRNVVGQEAVRITDRRTTGRIVFEAPAISAKDWFTTAKNNTTGPLALVHGSAAGNIVQVGAPAVQLLNPRYGNDDDIRTIEAELSLIPSAAGNDELQITVR